MNFIKKGVIKMKELKVVENNGKFVVDSREVAEVVGKEHKHLLRDIKNYVSTIKKSTSPKLDSLNFFMENTYKDTKGEVRPCYLITKIGCDMVANKLTGEKGILFTAVYVTQFEQMENKLKNIQPKLPQNYVEALKALVVSEEEKLLLQDENNKLECIIKTQKPKVETFDVVMSTDGLYSFKQATAELNYKGIGQNNLYSILRQRDVLMKDNIPYRPYIEQGYFKVVKSVFYKNGIPKTTHKTYFTMKGIHAVRKMLDKLEYKRNVEKLVKV
jgi:Rha family phage regulatory protein